MACELYKSYVGLDFFLPVEHQQSTTIALLTLEELVLIHMQKRGGQWAITYVVHSDCCDLFQSWTQQF